MRSAGEVIFRARQEIANLRLLVAPPSCDAGTRLAFAGLGDPSRAIEALRATPYCDEIERLAISILHHRFPLPGSVLETADQIEWRRDYRNGKTSGRRYFRFIPYLHVNEVGDHKIIWDLNRHQHLVVLAQAFLFTSDERYLREIEWQIRSWVDDNPFMMGINWTSSLEVGFRALSWAWVLQLVGQHLARSISELMTHGLCRHGQYLEQNLSIYFSPNTHLLGEAVALHAIGAFLPEYAASDRWRGMGAALVEEQMKAQVRDDGSHFEQSTYYHLYALDMFVFHSLLTQTTAEYGVKLRRMAEYLDALMGTARSLPLIGDDDGGRFFHPYGVREHFGRSTLATCAALFGEPRWNHDPVNAHDQAIWWLGPDRIGCQTSGADRASRLFGDAGVAVMLSGSNQVIVDAGAFGSGSGGHSHSDTLSLVVRGGSEEILVDAGTYTYVGDTALRNWFRGTAAHNTVRIDGADQAVPAGPFRWVGMPDVKVMEWRTTGDQDTIEAVCSYGAFTHQRRVRLLKGGGAPVADALLIVEDRIEGPAGPHVIEQFWHPGEPFVPLAPSHIRIGSGAEILVPAEDTFRPLNGWRSRTFGEKVPATSLVVSRRASLPATMWTVLSLCAGTGPCLRSLEIRAGQARLELADGNVVKLTEIDRTSSVPDLPPGA